MKVENANNENTAALLDDLNTYFRSGVIDELSKYHEMLDNMWGMDNVKIEDANLNIYSVDHYDNDLLPGRVIWDYNRDQLRDKQEMVKQTIDGLKNYLFSIMEDQEKLKVEVRRFNLQLDDLLELNNTKKFPHLIEIHQTVRKALVKFFDEPVGASSTQAKGLPIKSSVKRQLLKDLYDIAVDYDLIDVAEIDEQHFISAFMDKDSRSQINFRCSSASAVKFLDSISPLFIKWNASVIAESNRFITSRGANITASNINKLRKTIRDNKARIIEGFEEDIHALFASQH